MLDTSNGEHDPSINDHSPHRGVAHLRVLIFVRNLASLQNCRGYATILLSVTFSNHPTVKQTDSELWS